MAVRQGAQLAILVVLARLIAPAEFGTFALLSVFTGVATTFVEGGFCSALIQKQDATKADESTVFWINMAMGTTVALVLCACAPLIANFFGVAGLTGLTLVMAVNVLITASGTIHSTLIAKQLRFKQLLVINTSATVVGGGVAVVLALRGTGVWALAAQSLVTSAMSTSLLWALNTWRPTRQFSSESARKLFGFGGFLFVSSLLDVVYTRGYTVLIGRSHDVRQVGYYNRAVTTQQVPTSIISDVLARVAFPVFSTAKGDLERLSRGVRSSARALMLINVPTMLGLAAVAEPLVVTVFGREWAPSAPLLRILCLGGVLWPLQVINLNVLLAQGHSRLFFRLEVVKKALGIALLLLGALWGLPGIAISQAVFAVLALLLNALYTGKFLDYGITRQAKDVLPTFLISFPMLAGVVGLSTSWRGSSAGELVALVALGIALYGGTALIFRPPVFCETLALIRNRDLSRTRST
jgi:O-antigen/teichoic acid export membrane protein